MTVKECLNHYRDRGIKEAWMCPNLVDDTNFRITTYTEVIPTSRRVDERLENAQVTKHWVEDKQASICYDYQAVKPFDMSIYTSIT